jgi:hypothetical protein
MTWQAGSPLTGLVGIGTEAPETTHTDHQRSHLHPLRYQDDVALAKSRRGHTYLQTILRVKM